MATRRHVIIIGAGHNGLVTANLLADAGHRVTVLEARHIVGGACVSEELFPGYKVSSTSYVTTLFLPEIVRRFDLPRHGYRVIKQEPAFFVPLPDGRSLTLYGDDRDLKEIAKFSKKDAAIYPKFHAMLERIGTFLRPLILKPPPEVDAASPRELWDILQVARAARKLSPSDLRSLVGLATRGIAEYLEDWFETEELIAFLASQGIIGACGGANKPGTAFLLLHDVLGGVEGTAGIWGVVVGGMGGITQALAAAARERGVEVRVNARVQSIELDAAGRAEAVRLADGEVLRADLIASNATPRRTFLEMLPEEALPEGFLDQIRSFKDQSASLKVHLALSELPDFTAMPGTAPGPQHRGLINLCPTIDFIERAWEDCRRGGFSERPTVEACIQSVLDPSCAPPGKHIMSCFVQYGPRYLKEGTWEGMKETVADRVIEEIARYAPNFPGTVIARHVYTPEDLEKIFGLSGGNIFHGAMIPDQLFSFRPAAGYADYGTPIANLYICGSGAHPGGGVWGAVGWNAGHKIIRDIGRA